MQKKFWLTLLCLLVLFLLPCEEAYSQARIAPCEDCDDCEELTPRKNSSIRPEGYNCWDRRPSEPEPAQMTELKAEQIPQEYDSIIDLVDNCFGTRYPAAISLVNSSGQGHALLKLVLDAKNTEFTRARIEIHFAEKVEGHVLNIGDSITNNGFGGDSATQSRDSEAQVVNGDLTVFGDDTVSPEKEKVLVSVKEFVRPGSKVTFEIADNYFSWHNNDGASGSINSPHIFCLSGQEDKEGKVNYDIFIGLNQVVDGNYRGGKGVAKVLIKLFH
jgi:hypothetical protein